MNPRSEFTIRETKGNGYLHVSVQGEIDLATAPALENHLERLLTERRPICLDLAAVEYIDSTGVRILINAITQARSAGVPLELGDVLTPAVKHLFEVVQLHRLLDDEA